MCLPGMAGIERGRARRDDRVKVVAICIVQKEPLIPEDCGCADASMT